MTQPRLHADLVSGTVRLLEAHGRLSLRRLSELLERPPSEIRFQLEAFCDVDVAGELLDPLFWIEPSGGWPDEGPDPAPSDDDVVRFAPMMSGSTLGLNHADAATLGPLLDAAEQLRAMEPENLELASAVDVLRASLLTNVSGRAGFRARTASALQEAANERRRVQITYSAAWTPKLSNRVVEPFQVMSTSRGYELDAGPLDDAGQPRSFLVNRIRDFQVLDETFAPDPLVADAVARTRRLSVVTGFANHTAMWAVRHWSEYVEQEASDAQGVRFKAHVLPPVPDRMALICLVAGCNPDGSVQVDVDDADLADHVRIRARELLAHHGL